MKSIEVMYKGIMYRSITEAATAKFFYEHDIDFIYEPDCFIFQDGTKYMPDFYLPDQKTWVECKGIMTDKDSNKIFKLAQESEEGQVVIIKTGGHFEICGKESWEEENNVFIAKCKSCGKWYFGYNYDSWECSNCNFYDGDKTYTERYDGNEGLPDFQFDIWIDAD